MKKLMDEEIIKALECCGKEYSCERCILNTWLNKKRDCVGTILGGALDLINRQKAEIEKKTTQCERLEIYMDELVNQKLNQSKSKAIKEFAKRLKENYCFTDRWGKIIPISTVDNLVKEMTEE